MPCMILGDSIGAGVVIAAPECRSHTKIGISATKFAHKWRGAIDAVTIISLGANDLPKNGYDAELTYQLRRVRAGINGRVVWLLPAKPFNARVAIIIAAASWGDRYIDTKPYVGNDGLHPAAAGYQAIAKLALDINAPQP